MGYRAAVPPLPGGSLKKVSSGILIPRRGPVRVIPFGDSITQGNSSVNGNGLWSLGTGYAEMSLMKAGSRFQFVRNAGVAGNTTAQMLARIQTDVLAYSPDLVLLLGGTNDILPGMANSAYTACMNNLEQIVLRLLAQGVFVVLVTPPAKTGAPLETRLAQRYYYMLAQYYGLPLLDMFSLTVNPTTGNLIAAYTADGTHPNATAIQVISDSFGAKLANLETLFAPPYLAYYSDDAIGVADNLLPNGGFANQNTPPTPDYWTVNATNATVTAPAATAPFTGVTFNYHKTVAGGVYALYGTGINSGFSAGDTLIFSGQATVSGLTGTPSGCTLAAGFDSGGGAQQFQNMQINGTFGFSQEIVVPPTPGNLTVTWYVQDTGTYTANNWTVWNLTQTRAIWAPGNQ